MPDNSRRLANQKNDDSDDDDDIFTGCLIQDPVCHKCEENIFNKGELISCAGGCFRRFHKHCVASHIRQNKFTCFVCCLGSKWCFSCKTKIEEHDTFEKCEIKGCGNHFHARCIANLDEKCSRKFICAHHYCLVCSIEDRDPTCGDFLACIKCPSAYHKHDKCIPAGTVLLNYRWIICTDHQAQDVTKKTNVNFCFACGSGGTLLCCEMCPCAVHLDCYGLDQPPDGNFICTNCETGRKPMYGDIVWAKFGSHRWWPAEVTHPLKVPVNLDKFLGEPGVFIVRFFGTLDYGPVTRRSVYPFQADDDEDGEKSKLRRTERGKKYLNAVLEARRAVLDKQFCQLDDLPSYTPTDANKYGLNVGRALCRRDVEEPSVCSCNRSSNNPCGDEDCENRQVFIECHPKRCPVGDRCRNQRFSKRQYAPSVKFMTIDRGFGLRALAPIKKGDFVIEYVGEVISKEECNRRLTNVDAEPDRAFYFLELAPDKIIDAGPMGNDSRFINHSCDPNCRTERWLVNSEYRIGLFACKDIAAGEEILFHYNLDSLNSDFKTPCKCGTENCAGFIGRFKKMNGQGKNNNNNSKRPKTMDKDD